MSTKFVRPRIRREQYCLVHLLLPVLLGLEPVGGILDPPGHLLVLPTSQLLSLQPRIRMSFYLETGYRTHCGFMRIRIGIQGVKKHQHILNSPKKTPKKQSFAHFDQKNLGTKSRDTLKKKIQKDTDSDASFCLVQCRYSVNFPAIFGHLLEAV